MFIARRLVGSCLVSNGVIEQTVLLTFTRLCNASCQLSDFTQDEGERCTCLLACCAHEQMTRCVCISITALWIRWRAVAAHHVAAYHLS